MNDLKVSIGESGVNFPDSNFIIILPELMSALAQPNVTVTIPEPGDKANHEGNA